LGTNTAEKWADDEDGQLNNVLAKWTDEKMADLKFMPFLPKDGYLYSSCEESAANGTEHIGSYRVKVQYKKCGPANVMAQCIQNPSTKKYTFRKWNPDKENVPFGESVDADGGQTDCYCYYLCNCVNKCCQVVAEEVVFQHWDGEQIDEEPTKRLKSQDEAIQKLGCFMRPTLIFLCMLGVYMLFQPII